MFEKTYSLVNEWREDGGYDPQAIIHGIFLKIIKNGPLY